MNSKNQIPDISIETQPDHKLTLDRVGMRRIECPVRFEVEGSINLMPARVNAFVSLDKAESKGIHMSRLFLLVTEALENNTLSFELLNKLLLQILDSHKGISEVAEVKVKFDLPVKRKALLSEEFGWRQYPVSFSSCLDKGQLKHSYELEILYSSTCPCSAALSRHLVQAAFKDQFKGENISNEVIHAWLGEKASAKGVAHAQRSRAKLVLEFSKTPKDPLFYIDAIEQALGTPVQAAVKRIDEQEFARLNAEHLMFCEDAGRKLKALLEEQSELSDYYAEVSHEESLHPHDAVSAVVKGLPNGLKIQGFN